MRKRTKKAVRDSMLVFLLLMFVFIVMSLIQYEKPTSPNNDNKESISENVFRYQHLVETYAIQYEVENYVDVLLAMMMQESGGRGNDPMQSSESYCGQVGCIEDPEQSIKQGVYYFSQTLEKAHGDVELAVQSYNFGEGFINYVIEQNGSYSQELAIDFSKEMYENASDPTIYTCLREEAKQYNACYGDIQYVQSVMKYKEAISSN